MEKEGFSTPQTLAQFRADFFQRNDTMKKLVTLLAAAGMVVASTAPASAADVKLDGFYRYTFGTGSTGLNGKNQEVAHQRMRLGLTITASENLSGYTQFQLGTTEWGASRKHGEFDVQSRQYYIDWQVPAAPVKVRMGRQQLGLPADAFGGNNVLGAGWGPRDGIVVTANATDWLDVTALWARQASDRGDDVAQNDTLDVFGLAANLKFNGFSVAPWAAYASMGEDLLGAAGKYSKNSVWDTNYNFDNDKYESDSYYFGATATLTAFDPFKLVVSAAYGERQYGDTTGADVDDRKGWSAEAKASYKLGFGTPVLGAWYASGDDADDQQGAGHLPGINPYTTPTNTYFDGGTSLAIGDVDRYTTLGTWGVMVGLEDLSFLPGLTHAVTATWIQGTNNVEAAKANLAKGKDALAAHQYMSTSDSVVELALTTDYKIYKNLTACLELAYIINNFDEDLYAAVTPEQNGEDDWRAHLTFTYKF